MAAGDEPALVSLWAKAWQATMPQIDFGARRSWLRDWLTELQEAGATVLVAFADGPIGFATVDHEGLVDQLAVSPASQGRGVARMLVDAALARHPSGLHLTVNTGNERAVRFYKRYGFVISGHGMNPRSGLPVLEMKLEPKAR